MIRHDPVAPHWSRKRLRVVADLNPSKAEVAHIDREMEVSFIPMEAVGDDGTLDLERTRPIGEVESGYTYFREGDVTVAKITPCFENGKGAIMRGLVGGIGFGTTELTVLRPKPKETTAEFLHWLLTSIQFRGTAEGAMYGAGGQKRVPDNFIRDFVGVFPPLDEQMAIAAFLDRETAKIDSLVEEQRRLIGLLKNKRQAVISRAVTKGLNPNAKMKESGIEWLGEVPDHWEVTRLANIFSESSASGPVDLPILSVSIHDGVSDRELDDEELDRKVTRSDDRSKYKLVHPGDLVYNMMRAWQGGFGTVRIAGLVSPAYVVARPKSEFRTEFVEQLLRTSNAVEEMRRHSRGVTDFRLRLYWDEFKNIHIALPPLEEQVEIDSSLKAFDEEAEHLIDVAGQSIGLLEERRTALISAAVAGKIDVTGILNSPSASSRNPDAIRSAVASAVIMRLSHRQNFGRVKLQKFLYLAETYAGVEEMAGRYDREAAGPLDRAMLSEIEARLHRAGTVAIEQPDGRGGQVTYKLLRYENQDSGSFAAMLGDRKRKFDHLLNELGDLDTKPVEAVTTLFAVWNDFLIDGQRPTDDAIVSDVLNDWHPEKREKFTADELKTWLGWMRRRDIVPQGRNPRTSTGRLFP
ncbi:restriction endonuclease subunit S [Rhizobium ruizarguesonis]|uniref:restriction endonuclease subunit S n=1 Tax=Rhizobium ruizarguesonis TaxID=2081791 RepID=UPI0010301686|nr:restriction endonuclease subunit S [Rhizobium ruizarguesonis]TAZ51026.1 restriction endonuclease subunit S [Rhizobium ruizarguesonis]